MDVEVVRSERRKKTVQARMVEGVLRVMVPATFTPEEEAHWVDEMRRRMERQQVGRRVDLMRRARLLAGRYQLPMPATIEFSDRQRTLWGSCSIATGRIRIASRVAVFPMWVIDYLIVHELAHLAIPDHNREFWAMVDRYPLTERARGYLIAKSGDTAD